MCTHTHTHIHTRMHARTHACTHARTDARTHTHTHTHTRTHAHAHTCTHAHTHTHTHTLSCARTHTQTHLCAYTQTHSRRGPNQFRSMYNSASLASCAYLHRRQPQGACISQVEMHAACTRAAAVEIMALLKCALCAPKAYHCPRNLYT